MNSILFNNSRCFLYDDVNSIVTESLRPNEGKGKKIYCIGTPLYKGIKFSSVFKEVIKDYYEKKLNFNDLKGNFLFIFIEGKSVKILADKTQQHHIFYDVNNKVISNSFLSLVNLNRNSLNLNLYGFYEKISLGFNLMEDTMFYNIIRINPENSYKIQDFDVQYLSDHSIPSLDQIELHRDGIENSLESQKIVLNNYIAMINETFFEGKGDLGLSGGFDCRLLLALAQISIDIPLHLHTHATKGVHEEQSYIADELAKSYGVSITRNPTISPSELSNELFTQMLEDNIELFDGRSARHIGAYSQTYTESYKRKSMGDATYSLNGLGGEIYRDSYFTGSKKMTWDEWAERYLFLPGTKIIVPPNELFKISKNIQNFLNKKLSWDKNYYDIFFTHAYYGLIKMPLCNGSVVSAYNKVSPFLLPFIEYENVIEAIKAIPYFSFGGKYQAKLITRLSPRLAQIPCHYGGSFKSLSYKYYIWSLLKTIGSAKHRDTIFLRRLVKKSVSISVQKEKESLKKFDGFKDSMEMLKNIDSRLNLDIALAESTHKRNVILLGYFLKKFL